MWICKGHKIILLKVRDEKSHLVKCDGHFERFSLLTKKRDNCYFNPKCLWHENLLGIGLVAIAGCPYYSGVE